MWSGFIISYIDYFKKYTALTNKGIADMFEIEEIRGVSTFDITF